MKNYNPLNWYWYVAEDTTRVFSSVLGDYVPISDVTFTAWTADGTQPTSIASEIDLGEVLANQFVRPVASGVLSAYKDTHAGNVVNNVQFKIIFNHENRLRAIERSLALNGNPADLTANQAKLAVKALM